MTVERPPKGTAVQSPAAGLPPRSFGGHGGDWPAWIGAGVFFLVSCTIVLAVRGFSLGFFVVALIGCSLVCAVGGMLWPGTKVVGGDGWLMIPRWRRCRAWVRTGRLVSVSLQFPREGSYITPLLTLCDDEGRVLRTPLSALTQAAAASLLAGIGQSAEDTLANPGSPAAQAAVTALHELARAGPPPPAPQDPGEHAPSTPAAG